MTRSDMVDSNVAKNVDREVLVEEGSFRGDVGVDANPVVTQDGAVLLLEEGIEAVKLFLLKIHHKDDRAGVEKKGDDCTRSSEKPRLASRSNEPYCPL